MVSIMSCDDKPNCGKGGCASCAIPPQPPTTTRIYATWEPLWGEELHAKCSQERGIQRLFTDRSRKHALKD